MYGSRPDRQLVSEGAGQPSLGTQPEKIAIIGMAFRFPGDLSDPEALWERLCRGDDLVGEIPPDRWGKEAYFHPRRQEPGKSYTWSAGVLSRLEAFDADFFGISPREACQMDPQQRLLLELTWEALEDGGQLPERLAGSDCAVYMGISSTDYALRRIDDLSSMDAYFMTGNTLSIAANRVSYVFDLRGPSMAIDTACSSSLVALHQACRSLADGEAPMAIAGGVNLLLHPFSYVGFSKASMLSPDGRCRPFDASGNGYVRAEGGAVLLLKPLARAEADGDIIHAVIAASGVNCDGRTNGITVPSAEGQAQLLRSVYRRAGIDGREVTYIEAHGTGTAVGDPIEAAAIAEVAAAGRDPERPLLIGSVKSNLGHLEPASGMAGLVKTVLALKKRALPPSIHFHEPNPNIPFEQANLRVIDRYLTLDEVPGPLYMGVNSFGFGGANAHVLLQEYAAAGDGAGPDPDDPVPPLILSADDDRALRRLAERLAEVLDRDDSPAYYDIAWSSAFHRQRLGHRLMAFGTGPEEIAESLRRFGAGDNPPAMVTAEAVSDEGAPALVFSGNGSQWQGMGRGLLAQVARFREIVEQVDDLFRPLAGFSIMEELEAEPADSRLASTEVAQPALFALQVGIVTLLRERGLEIAAVCGHSVGEIAAAWAAGALGLEQAVRLVHRRSLAQAATRGAGRMAAAAASAQEMEELLRRLDLAGEVVIAAVNSPTSTTVAGPLAALQRLGEMFAREQRFYRLLELDYAFHSDAMDPVREPLLRGLGDLAPGPARIPFVSTVTGNALAGEGLDADYWWRNVRQPVRFDGAIGHLLDRGVRVFLEVGPHPILRAYINECLRDAGVAGIVIPTLQRDADDEPLRLEEAFHRACLHGGVADWSRLFPRPGRRVRLPTYPWQRERHWYPKTSEALDLVERRQVHPLLGYRQCQAVASWRVDLDPVRVPYLADHVVGGVVVMPAAGYVEMALAASAEWFGGQSHQVEDLEIRSPLVLERDQSRTVQFVLDPEDGSFRIESRPRLGTEPWTLNAVGRLLGAPRGPAPGPLSTSGPPFQDAPAIDAAKHYRLAERLGLGYGPAFRTVGEIWPGPMQAFARIEVPTALESDDHSLHPAFLDACFQSLIAIFRDDIDDGLGAALIPVRIGRLRFHGPHGRVAFFRTWVTRRNPRSVVADFQLLDDQGQVLAELEGCRFRGVHLSRSGGSVPHYYEYRPLPMPRQEALVEAPMPMPGELVFGVGRWLERESEALGRRQHFRQVMPLFDVLFSTYAYQAVRQVADGRNAFTLESLARAAHIDASRMPLLARLLEILREDDIVHEQDGEWILGDPVELPPPGDVWLSILGDHPSYLPELILAGRCGTNLAGLLRGTQDPHALLSDERTGTTLRHLLEDSPSSRAVNRAMEQVLRQIVADWPKERPLRVLEVLGDDGGLTRRLLPLLAEVRCDYLFTDPDEENLARIRAEFSNYPMLATAVLDPCGPAPELDAAGYDLVIAGRGLHALEAPALALARLRRLLVRGGLLLLRERHPDRFTDLTYGVHESWWTHSPGFAQPVSLLRSAAEWRRLLEEQGFDEVTPLREPEAVATPGDFLMLARNPDAAPLASTTGAGASAVWLLLVDAGGDSHEVGERLAHRLRAEGQRAVLAEWGEAFRQLEPGRYSLPPDAEGLERLLAQLMEEGTAVDHLIHLAGLVLDEGDDGPGPALASLEAARCHPPVALIHALDGASVPSPQLWLVTAGAAVFSQRQTRERFLRQNPSQSPLWGLGRVIMNEHPELRCRLIDLQVKQAATAAELLVDELLQPDAEDEVVLAEGQRLVSRLHRINGFPDEGGSPEPGHEPAAVVLDFSAPGPLKNLHWRLRRPRPLGPGEVEVAPRATGLNFRDVMYAMGLLSDEAVENGFAGASLGMEMSGVVTAVGPEVGTFAPGDPVIGFAPACFSSRVVTRASALAPKPPQWSDEEAATVPIAFFTAYYALRHLGRLEAGERVLIHGAAGGVGIAAIQIARYLGAEIFATAGSDEKRDFVRLLGADHVLDSRSLAFADEIMEITGGEGVDVVLNSLAGEAVRRNLGLLRPFGRFLELGKRDFYENSRIGLRPFRNNVAYFGIDADQLMVERRPLAARLFGEMMTLFEQGVLRPLPHRIFPASRVEEAFRYMQQSKQIGKIVVSFADGIPQAARLAPRVASFRASPDASYLVTGGVGGFGLETARWLSRRGARHLVLVSRSGRPSEEGQAVIDAIAATGTRVTVMTCDVSSPEQLQGVLERIERELPPLRGVVHAAMVLEDGLLRNTAPEAIDRVLAPKVLGAWNLHWQTRHLDLDFFVLYSSATTLFGNPGQGNYVAANLYLEALARRREAMGLPALALSWGAISDVGYLARNKTVGDALQSRFGGTALTSAQALDVLDQFLAAGRSGCAVIDFDWWTIQRILPSTGSPRFEALRREESEAGDEPGHMEDIQALIADLPEQEVLALIADLVTDEVAQILRTAPEKLDRTRPINDLGMDSLMGVELVMAIEGRFGIDFPVMAMTEGPTIERIARRITDHLLMSEPGQGQGAGDESGQARAAIVTMASRHGEEASAETVEQLVEELMNDEEEGRRLLQ